MNSRWALGCLGGILLCCSVACNQIAHNDQATLEYALAARPGAGWIVDARFGGLDRAQPRFRVLRSWGSFEDVGARIAGVKAWNEQGDELPVVLLREDRFTTWEIAEEVKGEVRVQYLVENYSLYESPEATFVTHEEALALGYCVFMIPDEITDYLPVSISVEVRSPWPRWASWVGEGDRFFPETAHDLWSGVVATGKFQEILLSKGETRVTVLTDKSWSKHLGMSVANRLLPVLSEMRNLFGAAPREGDLRVLSVYRSAPVSNKRSFIVGVSEESSFLCLATPDRYQDLNGLTSLAAHECLHFYLGGALTAEAEPPFQNNPELIWFFEGMTEYLSYKLMARSGVLSPPDLEQVRRQKAEKIERRALSDVRLAEAARMYAWPEVYELVYNKGYFLAESLDRHMEASCGEGALEAALRKLFKEHSFYTTHRHLLQEDVLAALETVCPGSAEWVTRYIIQNTPLPGDGWARQKKATPEGAALSR